MQQRSANASDFNSQINFAHATLFLHVLDKFESRDIVELLLLCLYSLEF